MPDIGHGTLGALSGAGGGLLYSLLAGKRGDGWGDHLRRAAIGAGIGGAAGVGYGALKGNQEYVPYQDPTVTERNTIAGRGIGNAASSALLSSLYKGRPGAVGVNAALGALIGGSDLTPQQRAGAAAGHGALMGLLSPRGIRGAATRGGNLRTRLRNMGAAAIYNTLASSVGSSVGSSIGAEV